MSDASARNFIGTSYPAGFVLNPDAWTVLGPVSVVQHRPSKTVFQVLVDLNKDLDEALVLEDFRAALVHYCGGVNLPRGHELERLRTEAVLVCLFHAGLVTLEKIGRDDQSEADDVPF